MNLPGSAQDGSGDIDRLIERQGPDDDRGCVRYSGKPLGVEAGSAMLKLLPQLEDMLKATGGTLGKIVTYQGYPEAYQDLSIGRIDFVVNTYLSLATVAKEKPTVFELGEAISKPTYIAWAVQKGNTELLEFLNGFIAKQKESGRFAELQKKWFGEAFPNLPVKWDPEF